jgi:hypothetical protein
VITVFTPISWQKRTINWRILHKQNPQKTDAKKSELIVNFGEEEKNGFHQFYIADDVGFLKSIYSPHRTAANTTLIELAKTIICTRENSSLPL